MLAAIRRRLIERRLRRTMKPDPAYLKRRLAALTPERRERFLSNFGGML